ncbi:ABC transporter substrate-binding protein [Actinotalea solisilvae]|uniref:ABC transporter substrate-binding protein n=1 Tax=Actinotalea solisilvae TaxID=2072922 RepID=UPI0018F1E27D|nr:ABC transporter substrate-binding protein [Actinotalea solisilvae]
MTRPSPALPADRAAAPARPRPARPGRRRVVSAAVVTAVAAASVLTACSSGPLGLEEEAAPGASATPTSEPQPGVTDLEVVVGSHHPLTGPAAEGYATIATATSAYFAYLNAQGGVNGRQIRYVVMDDGYNPAETPAVAVELVENQQVFAMLNGLGTQTHAAVLDYLHLEGVPDLFVASGSPMFNQPDVYPATFGYNVDYLVESKVLATYGAETFPGKRACLLGQDDDLGTDFRAGLVQVLGEGALAAEQTYSVASTDLVTQVGTLRAAGCEVVYLAAINAFSAIALGTAAQMGYHPQWIAASTGGDYSTVSAYLGDAGPLLLEGYVSANFLPPHDASGDAWTELFRQVHAEYMPEMPFNGMVVYGMSVAYLFAEALAHAGDDPTRESLLAAVRSPEVLGNGRVPLSLASSNVAYSGTQVNVVQGGEQHYVGTPYLTDSGAGPVVPYDGAPVALTNGGVPGA